MKAQSLFDSILAGDKEAANKILKKLGDNLPPKYRRNYMAHQPTEGKGIFGPNTRKTNPNAPDWKGQIMIDGKVVRFSGWIRQSSYGEFMSLSVDQPAPQQQYPKEVTGSKNESNTWDSDVPF